MVQKLRVGISLFIKGAIVLLGALFLLLLLFRISAYFRERLDNHAVAPPEGRFVQANDLQIYIEETGSPNNPTLIFVHGFGAWSGTWLDTMQTLAAEGYHCIAIDMPPFGFSDRPDTEDYSRPAQAKRILGVMDSLGIQKAILVGHSFGAGSTMEALFIAPERFSHLILVDAALGLTKPKDISVSGKTINGLLSFQPLRELFVSSTITNPLLTKNLLSTFLAKKDAISPERLAIYKKPFGIKNGTHAAGEWLLHGLLERPPESNLSTQLDNYRYISIPTALIWGRLDTTTPLVQGEHLASLIPNSQLFIIDTVGHIPQIESPEEFKSTLLQFLKAQIQ